MAKALMVSSVSMDPRTGICSRSVPAWLITCCQRRGISMSSPPGSRIPSLLSAVTGNAGPSHSMCSPFRISSPPRANLAPRCPTAPSDLHRRSRTFHCRVVDRLRGGSKGGWNSRLKHHSTVIFRTRPTSCDGADLKSMATLPFLDPA